MPDVSGYRAKMEGALNAMPLQPNNAMHGQIGEEISVQSKLLDELGAVISSLEGRMFPILKPVGGGPAPNNSTAVPCLVPLAECLRAHNEKIQRSVCQLATLREQVEL